MITIIVSPLLILITLSISNVASSSTNLENLMVVRYIDISTQLVIINTRINFRTNNSTTYYEYIIDPDWVGKLSHIEALDDNKKPLAMKRSSILENSGNTQQLYNIFFPEPIPANESTVFTISMVVTNYLKSNPKSVKQYEKHMALFAFNVYYYTLYFSHTQITYLNMGTTKVAQIDGTDFEFTGDSDKLKYGPLNNVEPLKSTKTVIHYENNSPFLVAEKVKRHIMISHWGYISVWDTIRLFHSGPKFEGPFKRNFSNYKKSDVPPDTRIETFTSFLPDNAFDIYIQDVIGKITSFQVSYDDPSNVVVKIKPRSILYGGWKTEYEIGYSVLISEFVTVYNSSVYELTFPLMDKIFENMVVKELEINIILPEGAVLDTMNPNFKTENQTDAKYCFYFDVTCRNVVKFKGYNLVEKHIINLSVKYTFLTYQMLVKPLAIASGLFIIFIVIKTISILQSKPEDVNGHACKVNSDKTLEKVYDSKKKIESKRKSKPTRTKFRL